MARSKKIALRFLYLLFSIRIISLVLYASKMIKRAVCGTELWQNFFVLVLSVEGGEAALIFSSTAVHKKRLTNEIL